MRAASTPAAPAVWSSPEDAPSTEVEEVPKKRPEDTVRAWHVERSLHRDFRPPVPPTAVRVAVHSLDQAGVDRALQKKIRVASANDTIDASRLADLVTREAFVRLESSVRHAAIGAIRGDQADQIRDDIATLTGHSRFIDLGSRVQAQLLTEFGLVDADDLARPTLMDLATSPAFGAMSEPEQMAAVHYVAGPKASRGATAARRVYLDLAWSEQRADVASVLLDVADFEPSEGARVLGQFFREPVKDIWFFESTHYRWHSAITFGAPNDTGLGYGQRWSQTSTGVMRADVQSPDRPWSADWMEPQVAQVVEYTYKCCYLARSEELALAKWLESNFVIHAPGSPTSRLGTAKPTNNAHAFFDEAMHTVTTLVSPRGQVEFEAGLARHST